MSCTPKRNNVQKQKLTVLLRSIISEYPAGGGVLRELCQNADDAGATKVVFVLDEQTYSKGPLLVEGLEDYQGPALLAYNDSQFSDEDFESLSNIGDSRKVQDPASTGKFGRGFNSVYNWTDCPQIVSGDSLVLLDPHVSWSDKTPCPGGPTYELVENSTAAEMRNQLAVFQSIETAFDKPYEGTIIRLPLRTREQAARSGICDKGTAPSDVKSVFQKFTAEIVETLLFLKSVRSITLMIGRTIFSEAHATTYDLTETGARTPTNVSGEILNSYLSVLVNKERARWDKSFVTEIKLSEGKKESIHEFAITHHMRATVGDPPLAKWARKGKLFPWVAIAAPLDAEGNTKPITGRLFTILPLPVSTRHPAHIHGMFSITPDRANIHNGEESSASDTSVATLGARWNKWLFDNCVTEAWLHNLTYLNQYVRYSGWEYWPAGKQGPGHQVEHGTEILRRLMMKVIKDNIPLLPTILDSVHSASACLYEVDPSPSSISACIAAKIPVITPPETNNYEFLHEGLCDALQTLSSKSLISFIHANPQNIEPLGDQERQTIMEMIMDEKELDIKALGKCCAKLLPLSDGTYGAFSEATGSATYKLATTDRERDLFGDSLENTINHSRLSTVCYKQMRASMSVFVKHTSIRRWNLQSAAAYSKVLICQSLDDNSDIVQIRDAKAQQWIRNMWEWVAVPKEEVKSLAAFEGLHLLPLFNNAYRKIGSHSWGTLDVTGSDALGNILRQLESSLAASSTPYPLHMQPVSLKVTRMFQNCGLVRRSSDFAYVSEWLSQATKLGFFSCVNENQHMDLMKAFASDEVLSQVKDRSALNAHLRHLPLFHKANDRLSDWALSRSKVVKYFTRNLDPSTWSSLNDPNKEYFGIDSREIKVPLHHENVIFIDNSDINEARLLQGLVKTCTTVQVLLDFVMPMIRNFRNTDTTSEGDRAHWRALCLFALERCNLLDTQAKLDLSSQPFVPTSAKPPRYISPSMLVHPRSSGALLLFPDEDRFPEKTMLDKAEQLEVLGLVTEINPAYVHDRIQAFSKRNTESVVNDVQSKVRQMFNQSPPKEASLPSELKFVLWVPASVPDGQLRLSSVSESRDKSWNNVLKYAVRIAPFEVSAEWKKYLSWDTQPSQDLVRRQLTSVLEKQDNDSLKHMVKDSILRLLPTKELEETAWIPGTSGGYYRPSYVFLRLGNFPPYMDTISHDFRSVLVQTALCRIPTQPSFEQLRKTLALLSDDTDPLSEQDLSLVSRLLSHATHYYPKEDFSTFKAPDSEGYMREIHQLTAEYSTGQDDEKLRFLHRDITTGVSQALKIPTSRDRVLQTLANSEDFAQEEDSIQMVKDSLQRYPIESTFNEYLANAEDSGSATKISWLIDCDFYERDKLMTPELAGFQGPSLMSYNDGVFTENDMKALIQIGIGSKGKDESKLGRFGRGSLTMYHWTCVPMILSGKYLVIFDPDRQRLHAEVHRADRRKCAGTKILIADVRRNFPDQLKPFENKFGFDIQNDFHGTIFRFPLGETFSGIEQTASTARVHLERYFDEAPDSLLFLEKIRSIEAHEQLSGKSGESWKTSISFTSSGGYGFKKATVQSRKALEELKPLKWAVQRVSDGKHTVPGTLAKTRDLHRLQARYGVAILSHPPIIRSKVFMDLPLRKLRTKLPICWTADMVLQSNRESLALGADEPGSEWNHWIIRDKVVPLYISTLEEICSSSKNPGPISELYWPRFIPESLKATYDPLTCLISGHFWNQIPTSSLQLYAKDIQVAPMASSSTSHLVRREEALFNLLDPKSSISILLCKILPELGYKNIVTLEETGAAGAGFRTAGFATRPEFKMLSSAFMRELLKNRINASQIPKLSTRLCKLLDFVLSDNPAKGDLDGCYAIPLKNRTLGMISLASNSPIYFLEDLEGFVNPSLLCLKPQLCVDAGTKNSREKLLQFNVRRVTVEDIPALVEGRELTKEVVTWIWSGFNKAVEMDHQISGRNDQTRETRYRSQLFARLPILTKAFPVSESTDRLTLEMLDSQRHPVIILPSVRLLAVTRFVRCLPGLQCIARETFVQRRLDEEEITKPKGFCRLMNAISLLASRYSQTIEQYLEDALAKEYGDSRTDILQHFGDVAAELAKNQATRNPTKIFAHFPIWPSSGQNTGANVPATKLTLPPDDEHEWSKVATSGCFPNVSYQRAYGKLLEDLGVVRVGVPAFLSRHLGAGGGQTPQQLPISKLNSYVEFLKWFSRAFSVQDHDIVIDGTRRFRRIGELYNHQRSVLLSTFRECEATHFLHPIIRDIHTLARLTKDMDTNILVQGAAEIGRRYITRRATIHDTELYNDAKAFLEMFAVQPTKYLKLLMDSRVATVCSDFPDGYRQHRMQQLVPENAIAILRQTIVQSDVPIAWSQLPVLSCQQTHLLAPLLRKDDSLLPTVVKHLKYLASNHSNVTTDEIPQFCSDLRATYKYLADKPQVTYFINKDDAIWLNIENEAISREDLKDSWTAASNLVDGLEYDTGDLRQVHDFLRPYTAQNGLLVGCGMQKVKPSRALKRIEPQGGPHADALCSKLTKFRKLGKYTDFTLQVASDTGQVSIPVHSAVLASKSAYFQTMFDTGMSEASSGIVLLEDFEPDTILAVVEYIYSGRLAPPESEDIGTCLGFYLELLKAADMYMVSDLKGEVEFRLSAPRVFLRPETVDMIQRVAREYNARQLLGVCESYVMENRDIVNKAREG